MITHFITHLWCLSTLHWIPCLLASTTPAVANIFALVVGITDIHTLIFLRGQSFWNNLFVRVLSTIWAVDRLISDGSLTSWVLFQVIVLLRVCWLHVSIVILSHLQLARHLLALACAMMRGGWALSGWPRSPFWNPIFFCNRNNWWLLKDWLRLDYIALEDADSVIIIQCNHIFVVQDQILNLCVTW